MPRFPPRRRWNGPCLSGGRQRTTNGNIITGITPTDIRRSAMKVWTTIGAAVPVLGMVGFADAAKGAGKGKKGDAAGVKGKITAVDATAKTITVASGKKKGGADVTVSVDT